MASSAKGHIKKLQLKSFAEEKKTYSLMVSYCGEPLLMVKSTKEQPFLILCLDCSEITKNYFLLKHKS